MSTKRKYIDDEAIDDSDPYGRDDDVEDEMNQDDLEFIASDGSDVESEQPSSDLYIPVFEEEEMDFDPEHFRTFLELEAESKPDLLQMKKKEIIDLYKAILFQDAVELDLSKDEKKEMYAIIEEMKVKPKKEKDDKKVKKSRTRDKQANRLDHLVQKIHKLNLDREPVAQVKKVELKPYQKIATDFLFGSKVKGLLVYHDVGLGKTFVAIMAIVEALQKQLVSKVLVVLPQKVIPKFSAQLIEFLDPKYMEHVYFYTYRMLQQVLQDDLDSDLCKDSLLVVDEAHRAKGYMLNEKYKQTQSSLLRKCAEKASKVLLLTATAIEKELDDLRNMLHMITPKPDKNTEYPHMEPTQEEEQLRNVLACRISYVTQEELGEEKPKIMEEFLAVPMSEEDWQEYQVAEENYTKKYNHDMDRAQTALYNNIRKMLLEAKFMGIVEYITKHMDDRIVVFNTYVEEGLRNLNEILQQYKKQDPNLDYEVGVITGATSVEQSNQIIEDYNQGKLNILLISRAASEGVEIRNTDTLIVAEQNWLFTEDQQLYGRVCRPGTITHDDGPNAILRVYHVMAQPPTGSLENKKLIDRYMYDRKQIYKHKFLNEIEPVLKKWRIESYQTCDDLFSLVKSNQQSARRVVRSLYRDTVVIREDDYSKFMSAFQLNKSNVQDRAEFSSLLQDAESYEFCF
jgi:superfamily II DNA or RNA helicase